MKGFKNMTKKEKINKELKDGEAILECARCCGLVGDPTRMKICWLLTKHNELSVSEIAEFLKVSASVVSHSLKKLRENNFVNSRRDHKQIYYSFSNSKFNKVLKQFLKEA